MTLIPSGSPMIARSSSPSGSPGRARDHQVPAAGRGLQTVNEIRNRWHIDIDHRHRHIAEGLLQLTAPTVACRAVRRIGDPIDLTPR